MDPKGGEGVMKIIDNQEVKHEISTRSPKVGFENVVSLASTTANYQCPTDPTGKQLIQNTDGFDGQYCSLPLRGASDTEYYTIQRRIQENIVELYYRRICIVE